MKYFSLAFIILTLLFFTSCQDNETLEESILVQNENTYIIATESEDFITIRVEAISDITDNRNGSINATDYCNISFDINNNGRKDADIDFGYESPTENYDICSYYFLEGDAITHCAGHPTAAVFSENFSSSAQNEVPHLIWTLKIPKEELNQNRNLSFTVKTIDNGNFLIHPPLDKGTNPILFSFDKTLKFNW